MSNVISVLINTNISTTCLLIAGSGEGCKPEAVPGNSCQQQQSACADGGADAAAAPDVQTRTTDQPAVGAQRQDPCHGVAAAVRHVRPAAIGGALPVAAREERADRQPNPDRLVASGSRDEAGAR